MRWVIAAVVAVGVGHRFWSERERLLAFDRRPEASWLVASGISYLAGLSPCAAFWWMEMRDRGARPAFSATLTAYFAGHLGKYVPGKGLVVVIRAGMMRDDGVSVANGTITCALETVLMMATGAFVALAILPVIDVPYRALLTGGAAALAAGLGLFALPPVTTRLGRLVLRPFGAAAGDESHASRWTTVLVGTMIIACGWLLMGLSLMAVLAAVGELGGMVDRLGIVQTFGLLTAVVALATVGGFVSLLPGGLGSRELILVETLGPVLGTDGAAVAAVAAILLRVVWIVAEAAGTGLCWIVDRQCKKHRIKSN